LNLPPLGCINVHASLLPRWRGAAPIHAAILNGDEETGITIMLMDEGMDTGPILKQEATPIENQESGGHLFSRLSELGAKVLLEALPDYAAGHLKPRSQNDSEATYAPRIKKSQGLLDFTKTAAELALQVRAFEPWPTSFTIWKNLRIVIRRAHAINTTLSTKGKIFNFQEFPAVSTAKGSLVLDEVQPAGRKRMSGADFMHGKPEFLDTILAQAES
jgi:methionyl-tRNA formyltransferase